MNFNRFVELWTHPKFPPDRVSEDELRRAEAHLQASLPDDYRSAVLQIGLPRPTIELLDFIAEQELDLRDVSDFLGPAEMISVTQEWRELGLPDNLVAFATDCMGNLFCFPTNTEAGGSVPVYFFDHDFETVDLIAPTFTHWVNEFCELRPS